MAGKEQVARDFQFLKDKVLAVLIFGSSTEEEGRDTDICIVAPHGFDIKEVFKRVDVTGKKYDVWTFEELPLYMKMEVMENTLSSFVRTSRSFLSTFTSSENCGRTRSIEIG